jgi:hypothetical protein
MRDRKIAISAAKKYALKKRGVPKCPQRKNAIKKAPEKAPKS